MSISDALGKFAKDVGKPESEVKAQALEIGLEHLRRDHILGLYLRKTISREEAIKDVGLDWVELAERQYKAVQEDIQWALKD